MKRLSRSRAIKTAAVLSFLLGLASFITFLPMIALGEKTINQDATGLPFFVLFWAFIIAILRVSTAYGTWHNQRWSILLTILASVADGLLAAPGILFAPTTALWLQATLGTLLALLIAVLCLWRDGRSLAP